MKKFIIIFLLYQFASCATYKAPDNFTTQGPLSADVFQIVVIKKSDDSLKTQSSQRESAYINARNSIRQECINQLFRYYYDQKKTDEAGIPSEKLMILKKEFSDLAEDAVLEQEYYEQDNSVVLILRIYKTDIVKKILNY